jgi:hypothetical protein
MPTINVAKFSDVAELSRSKAFKAGEIKKTNIVQEK